MDLTLVLSIIPDVLFVILLFVLVSRGKRISELEEKVERLESMNGIHKPEETPEEDTNEDHKEFNELMKQMEDEQKPEE